MKTKLFLITFILFAGLAACDDDSDDNNANNVNNVNNTNNTNNSGCGNGLIEGSEICDGTNLGELTCFDFDFAGGNLACIADCQDYDTSSCEVTAPLEAVIVSVNLHGGGVQKVNFTNWETGSDADPCTISVMTSGDGPLIGLCPDVAAHNYGNEIDFYDVDSVPSEMEFTTDGTETYVIGDTWRDGGVGETGFTMSENVYLLHLPDNTYAKFEVLSAVNGLIEILAFRSNDTNLECEQPSK
ncbi:MAG: hypothetical protein PF689_13195 [Deltaproteobacteria bacterium]|nr:hypothetical protein [Deltaproteobacteria bacterium]